MPLQRTAERAAGARTLTGEQPAAPSGLRVLDLTGPPGFHAAKLLADLGANVVRAESGREQWLDPGSFLDGRQDAEHSLYRVHFHANERNVGLDITTAAGRATL